MLNKNQVCLLCYKQLTQQFTWTSLFTKEKEVWLCEECQSQLVEIKGLTCKVCYRPLSQLDPQYVHDDLCNDCLRWEQDKAFKGVLDKNTSLYIYNDFLKEIISQFKFRGDYILAKIFVEALKRRVWPLVSKSLFVPIPLSQERQWERGFNQAEALIIEAGLHPTNLLKRIHGEKQSKKSRSERIHIPQVFQLAQPCTLTDKNIILVDDIYTTGSTLRHAAKILKEAGANYVESLTIAR